MRRSSEPGERAQLTVAELLARHGEASPATGRRRRRAAAEPDDIEDTVAHPVLPSNWRDDPDRREPAARPSAPARGQPGLSKRPGLSRLPDWAPAVGPPSITRRPAPVTPPVVTRQAPLAAPAPSDGPATDRLPRYDPASWSSRRPAGTQLLDSPPLGSCPVGAQPVGAQAPAGLGAAPPAVPEQDETGATTPETAPTDEMAPAEMAPAEMAPAEMAPAEMAQSPSRSPIWEWLAMVSQVGLGVVGGATLWLICEWLWQHIPVVALVVALAVITALVWVVRRVRRAEDLQTTVIAVLVGLFVTVSPAALLLVGR